MSATDRLVLPAYAAMNFAKHGFWSFFSLFSLIYLTDVVGLSPGLAGGLLLVSLLFDAVTDIPVGAVLDQLRARLRSYRGIIAGSALACAASFALFFGQGGEVQAQAWSLFAVLLAFRLAFTVFDLSDNALAARLTADRGRRTALSAARKAAAAGAGLLLGALAPWMLDGGAAAGQRFLLVSVVLGAGLAGLIVLAYRPLHRADRAAPPLEAAPYAVRWAALRRSTDARLLTGVTFLEAASTPVLMGGLAYYSASAFGSAAWAGTAIVAMTLAQIVSQPAWMRLARGLGKRRALLTAHAVTALSAAGFAALAGQDGRALLAALFLFGAGWGGVSTMRWSLAPDIIDRSEALSGVRVESGILALLSAAVQMGAGLAAGALGLGLAALGHAAGAPAAAAPLAAVIAAPAILAHGLCVGVLALWRFPEGGRIGPG